MSLSHFCMPCEQSLTAIGSRLYEIMSFSEQSAGMLAASYLRSSSLVFKLWVPLLPCISLCVCRPVLFSLGFREPALENAKAPATVIAVS